MDDMLHSKDKRILQELERNARQSYSSIGKKVGLSKQMIRYRIESMKSKGVIDRFVAFIDLFRIGFQCFMVAFQLNHADHKREVAFLQGLLKSSNVHWAISTVGKWNIVVSFLSRSTPEFHKALDDLEHEFHDVIDERNVFVLVNALSCPYGYIFETPSLYFSMGQSSQASISESDYRILSAINGDPLASYLEIAKKTSLSYETVKQRFLNMSEQGIIQGIKTKLNPTTFGYEWHIVLMELTHAPSTFYSYLKAHLNIVYVATIIGAWHVMIDMHVKNMFELRNVIINLQEKFPGVIKTYEPLLVSKEDKCHFLPIEQKP